MTEKIDLIERVEGHVGVNVQIKAKGKVQLQFGIQEGPRLFEKFLEGRTYQEVPFFVERICGFCPIVHNLSALKALENALGITPTDQVIELRRALNVMEFIQSHSAHLYLLTLPDFVDDKDDIFSVATIFPETVKRAVELRKNINEMIETLGGRAVHPLSTRIGGFSVLPSKDTIKQDLKRLQRMKPMAEESVDLIADLDYPELDVDTHYLALGREDERYPTYDGYIMTSKGKQFPVSSYSEIIHEKTIPYSSAKFSYIGGEPYLTGALSRVNLNNDHLHRAAKRKLEEITVDFPSDNPYHNNVAQAIEMLHCVEELQRIYNDLLDEDLRKLQLLGREFEDRTLPAESPRHGADAVEAPRGTLFHYYEMDENGIIQDVDILTPTAQSAANIEQHLNVMITQIDGMTYEETIERIKTLVRAYDPCISCSVH